MGAGPLTAPLTHEHRHLEDALDGVIRRLRPGAGAHDFARFRELAEAMRLHLHTEEALLFPVFDTRARIEGPLAVIRREHHTIEAWLDDTAVAIEAHDLAGARRLLRRLAELLVEHHLKEERILYPKTELLLTVEERAAMAAQIARP